MDLIKLTCDVEKQHAKMNEMVLAAKYANWENMKEILETDPHLINGIPAERSWSALHQAVYFDDIEAVRYLLSNHYCDVHIKAKQDRDGQGRDGITPLELARKLGNTRVIPLLLKKENETSNVMCQFPTFVSGLEGSTYFTYGIPYFFQAAALLEEKSVEMLNLTGCQRSSFLCFTKRMYNLLIVGWKPYCDFLVTNLKAIEQTSLANNFARLNSVEDFFVEIVKTYTANGVYPQINKALHRSATTLHLSGQDMLISTYAFFLQSVLTHWNTIPRVSQKTYRGLTLSTEHINQYQSGLEFSLLGFTSSSKSYAAAKSFATTGSGVSTVFEFDNDVESVWSPRDVSGISVFPPEEEVIYPSGSKFKIQHVDKNATPVKIYVKLLPSPE